MKFESTSQIANQSLKCLKCRSCEFLSFFQSSLDSHNCITKEKFSCPGCSNLFTTNESFSSHLLNDHQVRNDEVEFFFFNSIAEKPKQKIHIVDYQMLKKPDLADLNQPKSKIFIKDVTLLRKPDLPHIAIPNIFDSLDLTTTDDDIFDDFQTVFDEDQIFEDDIDGIDGFDFDESANLNNVEALPTPEPVPEVEIVTPAPEGIFARRNLCVDETPLETIEESVENNEIPTEIPTSKIYVRSHESLTSQVVTTNVMQQPSEASTPDCVIVSSEIIPATPPSKIFIRNIETLTNPQLETVEDQFYQVGETADNSFMNLPDNYPLYVRSYENLVTDTRPVQVSTPIETTQPRCKISIKNMNTLIEPKMQPPLINPTSMIFGQAQNLIIHMRPNQNDDSLMSYRDTSMTPDTLPGSSNVSVCGGNDDVIILDDSEVYTNFNNPSDIQVDNETVIEMNGENLNVEPSKVESVLNLEVLETPDRNETPNEKTVLQKLELITESLSQESTEKESEEQPMVRIPIDFNEPEKEPERKKVKIVKIIRVKRKREGSTARPVSDSIANVPLNNIQIVFKCSQPDCNQHFTNEQLLKYHRNCHGSDGIQIVCPECSSNDFKSFTTLHTHLWRSHKVDLDLFACRLCNFKTPILSRLKNFHEKIHSDEKNYICSFVGCEKSFKNSKQLKNHCEVHKRKKKMKIAADQTKPKTIIDVDDVSKRIQCSECGKGFSSESGLYIHSMEHKTDEKKFKCEECEYSTNDHNSFRRHKSQHSNLHHYKCPLCVYTSIQSSTYRKHLEKKHSELAESLLFKCSMCKFTTISKSKFDGHIGKHDNLRIKASKKPSIKIKVKSNLQLTNPSIHWMKDLLPNRDHNL